MAANSSSSCNDEDCEGPCPEVNFSLDLPCTNNGFMYTSFFLTRIILLLPLCIFILYQGHRRRRQQRSTSAASVTSHSDCFTYHMVIMELIGVLGAMFSLWTIFRIHSKFPDVGFFLFAFTWYGQMFFHMLTCVERYLAVVHPITYLSLRGERGVRVRNISIACVWLLCIFATCMLLVEKISVILDICLLFFILIVTSICSLSVLCALIRPGPGEQGGDRERVDQPKQRAFYTLVVILWALMLRFLCGMCWAVVSLINKNTVMNLIEIWLSLPSSLVLPLLFLHRAGKLTCGRRNTH